MPSSEHHMDKFCMEKLLSTQTTPVVQNCTLKASTLLDTKKGCTSFPGEILPANRSSLSSECGVIVGCDSTSTSDTCATVFHKRRTVLSQEHGGVDLPDSCQVGGKSRDMLIAPCSTKKRRFIAGEYNLTKTFGNSNEQTSSASQNAQGGIDLRCKDNDGTSHSKSLESVRQKGNLPADSPPTAPDETRGSAFLAQVRDKLSAAEYIDFVGYMKALKTKTMMISEVLLSISRLFSGPDRLPLLKRFKDYIPAKYHSLYEQYVGKYNHDEAN